MRFLLLTFSLIFLLAASVAPARATDRLEKKSEDAKAIGRGSSSSLDDSCLDEFESLQDTENRYQNIENVPDHLHGNPEEPHSRNCQGQEFDALFSDWQSALSALFLFFLSFGSYSTYRGHLMRQLQSTRYYSHRSTVQASLNAVLDFHKDPKALARLTPPPIRVVVNEDNRTSLTSGELDFTLRIGPIPVRWIANHQPGSIPTSFVDNMVEGPMDQWIHEHSFQAASDGVIIKDNISYRYPSGWRGFVSRAMFNRLTLKFLFSYRHFQTRRAVS